MPTVLTSDIIGAIQKSISFSSEENLARRAIREFEKICVKDIRYVFKIDTNTHSIAESVIQKVEEKKHRLRKSWWIRVPEHQRLYVWEKKQKETLIDSILNNYPIPDVIVTIGGEDGEHFVEDGQQRLTTITLFMLNQFSVQYCGYNIFYDEVPPKVAKGITLEQVGLKTQFDDYKIQVQIMDGFTSDSQTEMFERLNSGKKLEDGDRLWNRKESKLVKMCHNIATGDLCNLLDKHFGISWDGIAKNKTRNELRDLVGLVGGLAVKYDGDCSSFNVCSRSYSKVMPYLDSPELSNESETYKRMNLLLVTYSRAYDDEHPCENTAVQNRAFVRWVAPMMMHMREKEMQEGGMTPQMIEDYSSYWIPILRDFSTDTCNLDDPDHPHRVMYKKVENVEVDNPRKNSSGKLIAQRLELIKQHYACV